MAEEHKEIQARIWLKVDTLENWNNNPLLLGPGELALVTNGQGVPMNMKWGDKTTRKRFSDLPFAIAYDQGQFVAITGTVLPASTDGKVRYSLVGEGTYTRSGMPSITVPTGRMGIIVDDGTTWTLGSTVTLPVQDISIKTDKGGYTGTSKDLNDKIDQVKSDISPLFVERLSYNLNNPSFLMTGAYVLSTPIGSGLRSNSGWDIIIFECQPSTTYTISGWNTSRNEIALFTSVPVRANMPSTGGYTTDIITSGISGNIGYGTKVGGKLTITTPANCLALCLTVKSNTESATVYSQLQIELGTSATPYEPYGATIKYLNKNAFPSSVINFEVNLSLTDESFIQSSFGDGKVLKQVIKPFREIYYPFDVGNVYLNGNQVVNWTDETAPFRIDGTTLGGNHEANIHNKNRSFSLFIDGEKIVDYNRTYYPKKDFVVVEKYDVEGVTTTGIVINVSISYVFDKYGGCTIYTDIFGLKDIPLQDIMFLMANNLSGTNLWNYIPKSKSFFYSGVTYDFTTKYNMDSFAPPARLDFVPSRYDSIPDRIVAGNNLIGLAIGYLPVQSTAPTVRPTLASRKALQIHNTTKKIYMSAIDSTLITTLPEGQYYSSIVYKKWFPISDKYTANYTIETNDAYYLHLDFHTTGTKQIDVPYELNGREYEVIDSKDVNVVSINNSRIILTITPGATYAFIKIKFNK